MILKITENTTIEEIQQEFQRRFPYLKIEFYKTKHRPGEGSRLKDQYESHLTIGQAAGKDKKGVININGLMKVSELEQLFHEIFEVNAQVYRKSGDIWLQTITTDNWTLAEQNHHGRESTVGFTDEKEEPIDYREQE
jgi:hypothetical protein